MKTRKILVAALSIALTAPAFQSCKKGEEDPGLSLRSRTARVVGEWTVKTYEETSTDITNYTDDTSVDGETVKNESTQTISFDGTDVTMSQSTTETFDGQGTVWVDSLGTWVEKEGYSSRVSSYDASGGTLTSNTKEYYSGGNTDESNTGSFTATMSGTYTFSKDGTFEVVRTNVTSYSSANTDNTAYDSEYGGSEDVSSTITGTWSFLGKNKSAEFKNKERLALWFDGSETTTIDTDTEVYTDKDATDGFDYTIMNVTDTDTDVSSSTSTSSEPDQVWEIIMLKNTEMSVMFDSENSDSGTVTSVDEDFDWNDQVVKSITSTSTYSSSGSASVSMTLTQE